MRPALASLLMLVSACAAPATESPGVEAPTTSSTTADDHAVDRVSNRELSQLVEGNTALAFDLFTSLTIDSDANVIIGPSSIAEGLALPTLGASGATATEMATVLHHTLEGDTLHEGFTTLRDELESRENDGFEISVANRAFGQEGFAFLDAYVADLSRFYGAPLGITDFMDAPEAARTEINDWVAGETGDRIPELFPEGTIDATTRLALVNAVYLKADWHFPFNPELTRPAPFTLRDGMQVQVDTMNFNEFLPSGFGNGWAAVQLPYRGEEMSMIVIVPEDFATFGSSFDPTLLEEIRGSLTDGGIHLYLPKFELKSHTNLIDPLESLGMTTPFAAGADFSGMTGSQDLFISAIEHEAFVKIDETGTEAAAATGTAMAASHGPTVVIDRPFVFVIQDDATGTVLFLGQVTDPRG